MNNIPELVGCKLELALNILNGYNNKVVIKETFGKKGVKSDEIRIVRQTVLKDQTLQLIIAYF